MINSTQGDCSGKMSGLQLIEKRQKYETIHAYHIFMSVLTFGAWVPVWVVVSIRDAKERMNIDRELARMWSCKSN